MMFLLKEIHFKRKYREKGVNIPSDILDAVLLPCPYLRGDIVKDRYLGLLLDELGNLQVEARIVDKDDNIWMPLKDILLTHPHIAKYCRQMEQDRNETHIGEVFVMSDPSTSDSRHQVTTEKAKLSSCILFLQ
jgi:hypothetical protein